MIIKNGELEAAWLALNELAQERTPLATALKIRNLMREVGPRLEDVEAERQKLIEHYGQKDEQGKLVEATPINGLAAVQLADPAGFNQALNELMALTTEISDGLNVATLGEINVKADTLIGLGPLLEG